MSQSVDDTDRHHVPLAHECRVVTTLAFTFAGPTEDRELRAIRGRLGELARPDTGSFAEADVEVELVHQLTNARQTAAKPSARRARAVESTRRIGESGPSVGGDQLEAPRAAPVDRPDHEPPAARVGELVTRQLGRCGRDELDVVLCESELRAALADARADDRDRSVIDDRDWLSVSEPGVQVARFHLTTVTTVPWPTVVSIRNSSTRRRLPDTPSPSEFAVL